MLATMKRPLISNSRVARYIHEEGLHLKTSYPTVAIVERLDSTNVTIVLAFVQLITAWRYINTLNQRARRQHLNTLDE